MGDIEFGQGIANGVDNGRGYRRIADIARTLGAQGIGRRRGFGAQHLDAWQPVGAHEARLVTSAVRGVFLEQATREEFLKLVTAAAPSLI